MTNKVKLSKTKLKIYGVGINDVEYEIQSSVEGDCPYYRVWYSMLTRCYSVSYHKKKPTYIGCSVTPEWHSFSNFKAWMEQQDYINKVLDKDILVRGNKVYSPKTCLFVTKELNGLLSTREASRGIYAQGVSWDKKAKQFRARCNRYGKSTYIGGFKTEEEASKAYRTFKANHIKQVALEQTNPLLKEALLCHASFYLEEYTESIKQQEQQQEQQQ